MANEEIMTFSKKDYMKPVKMIYRQYVEPIDEPQSVYPDGRININCTCLHSALGHRCGYFIRNALKCFNESKTNPRGMDCEREFIDHAECVDSAK